MTLFYALHLSDDVQSLIQPITALPQCADLRTRSDWYATFAYQQDPYTLTLIALCCSVLHRDIVCPTDNTYARINICWQLTCDFSESVNFNLTFQCKSNTSQEKHSKVVYTKLPWNRRLLVWTFSHSTTGVEPAYPTTFRSKKNSPILDNSQKWSKKF